VREASESEFEDVAEFCRRAENVDSAQAESLAPGEIPVPEIDEESEPLDPKWFEQQLGRRARYTRRVKLIVSTLSFFVLLALVTRVLNRSSIDSASVAVTAAMQPATALPGTAGVAPAKRLEAQGSEPRRFPSPAVAPEANAARASAPPRLSTSARMPAAAGALRRRGPAAARSRAEPDAASVPNAARNAFVKPVSRSVIVTVIAPKIQSHSENLRNASDPPTARFPD
jgi:hypothetical protein